jgi:hypothetical protein
MVYESVSVRGIYYYKINEINVILMEGSQLVNLNDLFSRKVLIHTGVSREKQKEAGPYF